MGPGDLRKVLDKLQLSADPRLLVGIESADDAGVVRISQDLALVQTVDFFTPIVDDPYQFGQIAAANALSDVYAMGAEPLSALNIACFPADDLDIQILAKIIQGGYSKLREAAAVLAGGHTIVDKEIKYGLAVTGLIHPDRIVTNAGAKPGDRLILTKPIGTGIYSSSLKRGAIGDQDFKIAIDWMSRLNRDGSAALVQAGVKAATDITGFGLLGHALEMATASNVGLEIEAQAVPLLPKVIELAEKGHVPGGSKRNLEHVRPSLEIAASVSEILALILADAQTSGGLLIAASEEKLTALLSGLEQRGVQYALIGKCLSEPRKKIRLR